MGSTSADQVLSRVERAITQLLKIEGFNDFIPQVGSNLVYAKHNAVSVNDIAALSGRIIATFNGSIACGDVAYGASRYLASVILEAMKQDIAARAALNICTREDVTRKLNDIGLKVIEISDQIEGEGCPVTHFIKNNMGLMDAYVHLGDFGVEPTTTIIGENPATLVDIIRKLA